MCKKQFIYVLTAFLFCSQILLAQEKTVTGVVTDAEDGMPLPGVNVVVKGTTTGASTDFDGNFTINVSEDGVLVFSNMGYTKKEISVAGKSVINVPLSPNIEELEGVVVTALGIERQERALGYAVSSISAEELTESGNTNFASALYGKAAGVKITTAPGGASSAVNVQIRGVNSLHYDQQPLYVVDGVMIRNDGQNGAGGANNNNYWDDQRIRGNGILDIDPNNIESLNVLKGASASALYGSDASSGVIVITTKKGVKKEGLGIELNYNGTVEEVAFLPKFQNVYGPGYPRDINLQVGANEEGWIADPNSPTGLRPNFRAYANFGPKMEGQEVMWWDGNIRSYSPRPNNYKNAYRTGYSSNVNLAVSDRTDKLNYRVTYSRLDYQGTQEGNKLEKNTFALNSTLKLNDKISVDVVANYINTITENRPYQMGQVLGSFAGFFSRTEDMSLMKRKFRTSNGYKYNISTDPTRSDEQFTYPIRATNLLNFFWEQMRNKYVETENRLLSSTTLNWELAKGLKFRGRIGTDFTSLSSEKKQHNEYPVQFNSPGQSTGAFTATSGNYSILYGDLLLTYLNKIGDDFEFSLAGGFQSRSEKYKDQSSATSKGLVTENWFSLNNSYDILSTTYKRQEMLKYAYLGILNLSYKDILFLEGTARQEYASTLPPQNNSYFYPSVNGSFVFNDVLNIPEFMSYGKLRASYGVVGNAPPMYVANILFDQTSLQTINGSVPSLTLDDSYGNENLKSEEKHEMEFGLEAQFLNNRLGFDISYYNNKVKDQFLGLETAASVGAKSQIVNVGEIGSRGFELALNATPVSGDFRWNTRFNFAVNESKVNSLMPGIDELTFYTGDQASVKITAAVGEKLGNIYVLPRATDEEGNYLINDDGLYIIDQSRYVKAGNIMPKAIGGFSNTLSYKDFSLDFSMDYRFGGQMVSPNTKYMMAAGMLENTMQYRDAEHGGLTYTENGVTYNDGVLLEGVNANTGEPNDQIIDAASYYFNTFNWGNNSWAGKGSVYDNSYIKMREIVLGYTLPEKVAEKLHVQNLRVSLIGRNLFYVWRTLENIDPEAPLGNRWYSQGVDVGSTAASRSFGISLNAKF
ncbi:SusC/RagA family TonB-linked outer membrane protein [Sinomicrobium kalidii]|uniref:SusC/RagA family TonB-linked outer membrane protein n=1 Tax=Sinomicrobium kalidii TaxID=2900738 RepID=UPI001E44305B|nr:SusC/RagA family TonB-linked outer membrane protein [Sinomicrobium kalidii]UGU17468.1 SusC/RagA family TonB-linked outer membrane protein [Sinomicrobium kalidii]